MNSLFEDPIVYDFYHNRFGLLFPRHKYNKYIELVKSELIPAVNLVNKWITEVGNPALIEIPPLKATTDAINYNPNIVDPAYHL